MSSDAVFAMVAVLMIFYAFGLALCRSAGDGDRMARDASRARRQELVAARDLRPRTGQVAASQRELHLVNSPRADRTAGGSTDRS